MSYQCEICESSFDSYYALNGHMVAHGGAPRITVKCDYCGEEIKRTKSYIGKHNFCSWACFKSWKKENPLRGTNNPAWKGGKTKRIIECLNCGRVFVGRGQRKFCSQTCSNRYHMKDPVITAKIGKAKNGMTLEEIHGVQRAKELKELYRELMIGNKRAKGYTYPEEKKVKYSQMFSGPNNPMFGKTHTEEARKKMEPSWFKKDQEPWNKGYGKYIEGEDNPNWRGGISFEPYDPRFGEELKEQIRARDGYMCQRCGIAQNKLRRALDVHHIDYDKKNSVPGNLISLCSSCNLKVNFNREHWTEHFMEMMNNG